ncbi:Putative ROK-family transcriptional regulator [hydrothermal vent metagenome]|uniref:ROK-family transcriptional regulator n=1 Tax=hydrothermal vent metagenome TaxID=652676 RepID=A0A3B1DB07_9ZZZZ
MTEIKNDKSKNDKENLWLGFDLGGTKMLAEVFDRKFRSLGRKRRKTRGNEGAKAGVERIIETINDALEEAECSSDQLSGIGIGCPGPLDLNEGVILEAPNLGWKNVAIRKELESKFKCPVIVANDVDLGLYGEYRFGIAQDSRSVVGAFIGTGIGGACIYEGRILRGKSLSCMEVGHLSAVPNGPLSGAGHAGSLEAVASRLSIAGNAVLAAYRGQAPYLLENFGTDISNIRSGAIAKAIQEGDTAIKQIVQHAAVQIGKTMANVIHLLAPDTIVLGGGMVEAIPELFVETVKKTAKENVLPSFRKSFEVVAAELSDDATVQGAAAWAESNMEQPTPKKKK